jgi:energy-coupling factor transport system ATP-binding protein
MIKINDLNFNFADSPRLFSSFNFRADPGDTVLIKGTSGSGKTTLLNIICGVIPKVIVGNISGRILINDIDLENLKLPEVAPHVSLLMQDPELQLFFPTVEQEIAFAPENLQIEPVEIESRIKRALRILQIEHLRYKETAKLSFGEKKMVALAALLALDPQIFLLDEPTAGISGKQIECIKNMIRQLADTGKIVFIAEHQGDLLDLPHKTIDLDNVV